jgi:hypothetical protein
MTLFFGIFGVLLITGILWDVFETIVLPRRVTRRIRPTRLFYRFTWAPWRAVAGAIKNKKRREIVLGVYGPLSILALLTFWAWSVIVGFALLHWAIKSHIGSIDHASSLFVDFYYSGTTFFTLGLGDVAPYGRAARALTVVEASIGFGMLALVIGYLPVLYQAFSRREVNISMLDARAGTPPTAVELLKRHQEAHAMGSLDEWLRDWEMWSADLMESHLSYPALCFFRSQHDNQSWLAALSMVLDTCSLVMVGIDGIAKWQAQLTFKMARHALVDISQIFNTSPLQHDGSRMTSDHLMELRSQLAAREVLVSVDPEDEKTLEELRALYEPYTQVLSDYLLMTLPGWLPQPRASDNWQTSAWEVRAPAPDRPFQKCMTKVHGERPKIHVTANKPQ